MNDELEKQEKEDRDIIAALGQLSCDAKASPDLFGRVMAQADQLPSPRPGLLSRLINMTFLQSNLSVRVAFVALFLIALIGAVPQYITWINSYAISASPSAISEVDLQNLLHDKNERCVISSEPDDYAVITNEFRNITVLTCPSGDVMVGVYPNTGEAIPYREWISLQNKQEALGLPDWIVPKAYAMDLPQTTEIVTAPIIKILCQKWISKNLLKQRVRYQDGSCADEVINTKTRQVIKQQKAPCTPDC